VAFIASVTLLPLMMMILKPLGPETAAKAHPDTPQEEAA
jgi:hypothetical protein